MRRTLSLAIVLVGVLLACWAFWWEPRRLVTRAETIRLPCWITDPLLLGVVSDLHVGSPGTRIRQLERVVETLNAARPDAVLLLGNFVIQGVVGGRFISPERIAEQCCGSWGRNEESLEIAPASGCLARLDSP